MALNLSISGILGGIVQIAQGVTGRVLAAMGIGFANFTGVDAGLNSLRQRFIDSANSAGPSIIAMIHLLKIDVAFSIILAAVAAKLLLGGLFGGTVKKMFFS